MLQLQPVSPLDTSFMTHTSASFLPNDRKGNTEIRLTVSLVSIVKQQASKSGKHWETTGDRLADSPLYSQSQTCPADK